MEHNCYWTYCPDGSTVIIAGPTLQRYNGHFRSLTSARRFARRLGYKLVRDHNPERWHWNPYKVVEVFPLAPETPADAEVRIGYQNPSAALDSAEDFQGDDL